MNAETQYLETISRIIYDGIQKTDRTGVGTSSVFGNNMSFNLEGNTLPVFTTRRTFFRGAVEELLWILRGDTDAKHLQEKNIHIWDGNTTRDFLDNRGLSDLEEGDAGYIYGQVLRHYGAEYEGCGADYTGKGVDQLERVVNMLKNDPHSRRMMTTHYDPAKLDRGCLEPCHTFQQFYVDDKDRLHNILYMRSVDWMCGCPLNVIVYSLWNRLMADVCGLTSGSFTLMSGDTHIYKNHLDGAMTQLNRQPYPFPTVNIKKVNTIQDIENLCYEDFELVGYKHHEPIKYEMAV